MRIGIEMEERHRDIQSEQIHGLERKFRDFLKDVSLYRETKKDHEYMGLVHTKSKATLQWGDTAFREAITATQKLCPNISRRRIGTALRDLMVETVKSQVERGDLQLGEEIESVADVLDLSKIEGELSKLVQSLNEDAQPQIVLVPVEGLVLNVKSLIIGRVAFYARDPKANELDQALQNLEERKVNIKSVKEDLHDASCYAKVETVGDDDFARNDAVRQTVEATQILNLYLSSSRHQPHWSAIQIARVIISQTKTGDIRDAVMGYHQSFPTHRPLELDRNKMQQMLEWGLEELVACFQPENKSDIAQRIRRAVTWYSRAVDANSPEEKFVNLTTALESLLVGDEGKGPYATTGSISQNIGERAAFLRGDNFENRMRIEKIAKDLYALRSAIVHRGESVPLGELVQMDELVAQATLTFLRHKFTSWSAFQQWVAKQRYDEKTA
jgi:hypothetical protein